MFPSHFHSLPYTLAPPSFKQHAVLHSFTHTVTGCYSLTFSLTPLSLSVTVSHSNTPFLFLILTHIFSHPTTTNSLSLSLFRSLIYHDILLFQERLMDFYPYASPFRRLFQECSFFRTIPRTHRSVTHY